MVLKKHPYLRGASESQQCGIVDHLSVTWEGAIQVMAILGGEIRGLMCLCLYKPPLD
jgi:hypothetical protein